MNHWSPLQWGVFIVNPRFWKSHLQVVLLLLPLWCGTSCRPCQPWNNPPSQETCYHHVSPDLLPQFDHWLSFYLNNFRILPTTSSSNRYNGNWLVNWLHWLCHSYCGEAKNCRSIPQIATEKVKKPPFGRLPLLFKFQIGNPVSFSNLPWFENANSL